MIIKPRATLHQAACRVQSGPQHIVSANFEFTHWGYVCYIVYLLS